MNLLPTSIYPMSEDVPQSDPAYAALFQRLFDARKDGCLGITLNENEVNLLMNPPAELQHWVQQVVTPTDTKVISPFVLYAHTLYTGRDYYYETRILEGFKRLKADKSDQCDAKVLSDILRPRFEANVTGAEGSEPDWQWVAALHAAFSPVSILTGGPGTGKTTSLSCMLGLLLQVNPDLRIRLAAPTGKAAMRMRESLLNSAHPDDKGMIEQVLDKYPPSTLHRLLESRHQSPFFKRTAENPLEADVVVVDECSMIGAALFAHLMDALKPGTQLILLGDPNQLASVEAGSVFADICKALEASANSFTPEFITFYQHLKQSGAPLSGDLSPLKSNASFLDGHLVRLMKTYRYDANSVMGRFTAGVTAGNTDCILETESTTDDTLRIDVTHSPKVWEEFAQLYLAYMQEPNIEEAIKKFNEVRILAAIYATPYGVDALNEWITQYLRKYARSHKDIDFRPSTFDFYHNQPIMVTQNMHSLGLSNGDVGIIRKRPSDGKLMAYFSVTKGKGKNAQEGIKEINPGLITHFTDVFAMSIHKSQGSEFKHVLMVLPECINPLLTRELIYTGLTRGKSGGQVVLQASNEVLNDAIKNTVQRVSNIACRLTQ
jgi:exodeoxyribonuclease V alpha subunit